MINKFKNKKIILLSLIIILIIVSVSTTFFITDNKQDNQDNINITENPDEIIISLEDNNSSPVNILDPNEKIIKELSNEQKTYTINKFSTDTEYGEYTILSVNNTPIETFIIEQPSGENSVNVTVINEYGDKIENANITISDTKRTTSENGKAKFYDVRLGHHMFKAEADEYETYNTTFEIISSDMDINVTLNKK